MLTADQLDVLPGPILDLFEEFHLSVIQDIARRVAAMDYNSAAWQMQRMIEAGKVYDNIVEELAQVSGYSETVLQRIFQDAGVKALRFDDNIYRAAGLDPLPLNLSPAITEALVAGLNRTKGTMQNLTATTANAGQDAFIEAADLAYMQISTGAFDYNTAIQGAVEGLASRGLQVIHMSGRREKLDVAVRRTVLTGVNMTVGDMQVARADEMGTDLVQTTAHIGARNIGDVPENHELWQGKVFTRGTDPENADYPDFKTTTGYGTGPGLLGWNCRHSFYPFFKGISEEAYSKEDLDYFKSRRVTYNGKEMSFYEATQEQRKIERKIRAAKRQKAALTAAGQPTDLANRRVRDLQAEMRDFTKQTGLKRQYPRERVAKSSKVSGQAGSGVDLIGGDDMSLARHGKLFSFDTQQDDVIYRKPFEYTSLYSNERIQAERVVLAQDGKGYILRSHKDDALWALDNQDTVLRAILEPIFIDAMPRRKGKTGYNIAHIIETGDSNFPYLNIVVNFMEGKENANIFNLFRVRKEYLFTNSGELRERWLKLN